MFSVFVWALSGCRREEALPPGVEGAPLEIVINEVLALNDDAWLDTDAPVGEGECPEFDDYIEIYNRGDRAVALSGLRLADTSEQWTFPAITMAPGEHLLLVADEQPEQGPLHLPYQVSAEGEVLVLSGADGEELDRVVVPPMASGISWARYGDGSTRFRPQQPSAGSPNESPPDDPCLQPEPGLFDDHSAPCISTIEGFASLADNRSGLSVVKFDLLSFPEPSARRAVFLDTRFYELHDEWYLFRMLNGQLVEGEEIYAPYPGNFATIDEIYDWAATVDLESIFPREVIRFASTGRLTSDRYYSLALGDPRVIGVGTLVHAPANETHGDIWSFELEYGDDITHDDLVGYFETLQASLPATIGDELRWLIRSPYQEALAQGMEVQGLPYADRLLRYSELSAPGRVEVYHEGIIAGPVRVIAAGEPIDSAPGDILVLEEIPDVLPPCAALITSVPQTPLAHIALLAESRGIPNLHVSGLADDPQWTNWSRARANIVLRATLPDQFEASAISDDDWQLWKALQTAIVPELERVDTSAVPWTVDLAETPADELLTWRPLLGGKSSAFLVLLDVVGGAVDTPEAPLGISVRAYHEHVDAMGFVDALLADPAFGSPGDTRGRYLVLEGETGYAERFTEPGDAAYLETFMAEHGPESELGALARSGGLRAEFERIPIASSILDEIVPVLSARFAHYAPEQGLRFRSSSNVEDVEGFVGAGLYESHTGYLDLEIAAEEDDQTVVLALQRVWASYWGYEAFEERHIVKIPHENGGMGVLVHANFDDDLEKSNGVITVTREPTGGASMVVNSQVGAISVTNPPTDSCLPILPEVVVVSVGADGVPQIERRQASTELPSGDVLSEEDLLLLLEQGLSVVDRWLGIENQSLPEPMRRSTLTLDMEFREVDGSWPLLASGETGIERLVLKQARSLEPSAAGLPDEVQEVPFPRDLLARARSITEVTCSTSSHTLVAIEALTDPSLSPDLGYSTTPFTASLTLDDIALDHLDWGDVLHLVGDWGISVDLEMEAALQTGIVSIRVEDSELHIDDGTQTTSEPLDAPCVVSTLWASPDSFLEVLLE